MDSSGNNKEIIYEKDINPENFEVVWDGNEPICEGDNILMFRKKDEKLLYINQDIVKAKFPSTSKTILQATKYTLSDDEDNGHTESEVASSTTLTQEMKTVWSKNEIVQLIQLYQDHETQFKATTIKNDCVWKLIAAKLKGKTSEQCKNKFKYLKSKYLEKKDNMSGRRTGEKAIKFEYFEQLDAIFNETPNVTPIATASSSQGGNNIPNEGEEVNTAKKRKRSILEKQLQKFEETVQQREEAKKVRHEQLLERQDRAVQVFEQIATIFAKLSDNH